MAKQVCPGLTIAMDNILTGGGVNIIWVPSGTMTARTTNGAAAGSTETTTNKVMLKTLDFADGSNKLYAQFNVLMPSEWDGGTITARFVWTSASTSTNSVVWGLQGASVGDNEAADAIFGTAKTVSQANSSSAYNVRVTSETSPITINNANPGEWVVFQVFRDPTDAADTLAATASLLGLSVYWLSS